MYFKHESDKQNSDFLFYMIKYRSSWNTMNVLPDVVQLFDLVSNQVCSFGSDGWRTGQTAYFLPSPCKQRWMQPMSWVQLCFRIAQAEPEISHMRKCTKSKRNIKFRQKLFSSLVQIRVVNQIHTLATPLLLQILN